MQTMDQDTKNKIRELEHRKIERLNLKNGKNFLLHACVHCMHACVCVSCNVL